ncbi:MAG TPA: PQQ-binding-like beta-propeller repeat protein [Pirellulales bacterium]
MVRSFGFTVGFCLGMVLCLAAMAADWPQFRGPGGSGLGDDAPLPTQWAADQNIRWKAILPGVGWSSPVIWGDKVFLTAAITENQSKPQPSGGGGGRPGGGRPPADRPVGDETDGDEPRAAGSQGDGANRPRPGADGDPAPNDGAGRRRGGRGPGGGGFGGRGGGQAPDVLYQFEVYCLDRNTGNVIWKQLATERKPSIPTHRTNTYASETPVTDGQRVYAYFGMTGVFCYDLDGKLIWTKDFGSYPMAMGWGTGSSPVLADRCLIMQCDNDKASFLVALDKLTGEEKWRVARDDKSSWATPNLWRNKVRTELVTVSGQHAISYDPIDGKVLWTLANMRGRCSATPVGDDERVYLGTGGGMGGSGPLVAIRAGATGSFELASGADQPEQIAWSVPRGGPPMASPLVYRGYLYVLEQRGGLLSCYNAADGTKAYQQRVPDAKGFTASPWANDGKVFCLDEGGQTFVIKAGPDFELLAENKLDEMCWATPAAANGALFLRGTDHLWCIKQ